jgi:cell shape-determining protein MreC
MTYAFDISTSLSNFIQYGRQIFLTNNGSNSGITGIILDGMANGGITITNLTSAVVLGTDTDGKITVSTGGAVYNLISGFALS